MAKQASTFNRTVAALEIEDLQVSLGQHVVLSDLNLNITQGRWSAIVGPNGAGKSTLLQALAGVLPYRGEVRLLGQPVQRLKAKQRASRIAWLAQGSVQSADDLTTYDVVMLGRIPHQAWLAGPSAVDHSAVARALALTHAWSLRDRALGTLSGGERQRVLLARLLAVEADVLLMDEPLANLDPPHQADWLRLVRGLVSQGKTVLSVLHELTLALYADDVIVMSAGTIQHIGARDEPALHRAIEKVFEHRIAIRPLAEHWVALPQVF